MQKIKNIEFFRFIFAIIIVYLHFIRNLVKIYPQIPLWSSLSDACIGGFCCDLFFIIAGFFLFFSLEKTQSIFDFILDKIKRLWPVLAFSYLTLSICALFKITKIHFSDMLLNLLFLQSSGLTLRPGCNIAAWFVSALFIVSVFYAFIAKSLKPKIAIFTISLCTYLSYSAITHATPITHEGVRSIYNFALNEGILRGLAGIGCGYLLAIFWKKLNEKMPLILNGENKTNLLMQTIVSVFEISLFALITYVLVFGSEFFQNKFVIVVLFLILFILLLLKKGILSKLLDNNFSVFWGKYAYSIYLMQALYNCVARKYFWKNSVLIIEHPILCIFLNIIGYIVLGVITYHLVEKPCNNILKKIKTKEI